MFLLAGVRLQACNLSTQRQEDQKFEGSLCYTEACLRKTFAGEIMLPRMQPFILWNRHKQKESGVSPNSWTRVAWQGDILQKHNSCSFIFCSFILSPFLLRNIVSLQWCLLDSITWLGDTEKALKGMEKVLRVWNREWIWVVDMNKAMSWTLDSDQEDTAKPSPFWSTWDADIVCKNVSTIGYSPIPQLFITLRLLPFRDGSYSDLLFLLHPAL